MNLRQVVLIHPGREGRVWGRGPAAPYTLMRLASDVPDDIPVQIWDQNLDPIERKIRELGPHDLVGITSKTLSIETAEHFAGLAHAAGVRSVVVGGPHATLMPDDVARWADVVVTGEAYTTWPQIIQDFMSDSLHAQYDDTSWADLSTLRPIPQRVLDMVDENHRYWTPMMEITRGCPRNCSFCTAIRVSGQRMRLRPVEQVVEEIQRRKLKRFFLTDDNFGLAFRTEPDYLEELFTALEPLPLHGWTAQGEMIVSAYPELLVHARRAHLDKLFIGFESVNPGNRRELGGKSRGQTDQYLAAIRAIQAAGVAVAGLFVFGFDEDTPQTLLNTRDFVRSSGLDSVSITVLTPYPGTPFRAQLIHEGRLMLERPWRYYDTAHLTYYPQRMAVEEMQKVYDLVCRQLYSAPSIARRGLRSLARHPLPSMPRKFFGSFSTDYGYRKTYEWRLASPQQLLGS